MRDKIKYITIEQEKYISYVSGFKTKKEALKSFNKWSKYCKNMVFYKVQLIKEKNV